MRWKQYSSRSLYGIPQVKSVLFTHAAVNLTASLYVPVTPRVSALAGLYADKHILIVLIIACKGNNDDSKLLVSRTFKIILHFTLTYSKRFCVVDTAAVNITKEAKQIWKYHCWRQNHANKIIYHIFKATVYDFRPIKARLEILEAIFERCGFLYVNYSTVRKIPSLSVKQLKYLCASDNWENLLIWLKERVRYFFPFLYSLGMFFKISS